MTGIDLPMKHDPLRDTDNTILSFIKSRQLSPHPIIGVGHVCLDYSTGCFVILRSERLCLKVDGRSSSIKGGLGLAVLDTDKKLGPRRSVGGNKYEPLVK